MPTYPPDCIGSIKASPAGAILACCVGGQIFAGCLCSSNFCPFLTISGDTIITFDGIRYYSWLPTYLEVSPAVAIASTDDVRVTSLKLFDQTVGLVAYGSDGQAGDNFAGGKIEVIATPDAIELGEYGSELVALSASILDHSVADGTYVGFLKAYTEESEQRNCSPTEDVTVVVDLTDTQRPLLIKSKIFVGLDGSSSGNTDYDELEREFTTTGVGTFVYDWGHKIKGWASGDSAKGFDFDIYINLYEDNSYDLTLAVTNDTHNCGSQTPTVSNGVPLSDGVLSYLANYYACNVAFGPNPSEPPAAGISCSGTFTQNQGDWSAEAIDGNDLVFGLSPASSARVSRFQCWHTGADTAADFDRSIKITLWLDGTDIWYRYTYVRRVIGTTLYWSTPVSAAKTTMTMGCSGGIWRPSGTLTVSNQIEVSGTFYNRSWTVSLS